MLPCLRGNVWGGGASRLHMEGVGWACFLMDVEVCHLISPNSSPSLLHSHAPRLSFRRLSLSDHQAD